MNSKRKHCFLIASHFINDELIRLHSRIAAAVGSYGDVIILLHSEHQSTTTIDPNILVHSFCLADLDDLAYTPIFDSLIPGSNHFPVLHYFQKYPGYDHYWYIENDIYFNGDWKSFFDAFRFSRKDFLSSQIKRYRDGADWPWWPILFNPKKDIPLRDRLRSFNPLYRLTRKALLFIHEQLSDNWSGHHEVLIPTLLFRHKFTIGDFGGEGEFVKKAFKNKFYSDETFRWRPIFEVPGENPDTLYHPVKINN